MLPEPAQWLCTPKQAYYFQVRIAVGAVSTCTVLWCIGLLFGQMICRCLCQAVSSQVEQNAMWHKLVIITLQCVLALHGSSGCGSDRSLAGHRQPVIYTATAQQMRGGLTRITLRCEWCKPPSSVHQSSSCILLL